MNKVMASFTRSERSIIIFVVLLVSGGFGLQKWQQHGNTTMAFTAGPAKNPVHKPVHQAITAQGRIDINSADLKALETLPGIGPAMAAAIDRQRIATGGFKSMTDLDTVPGIGPAMLAKLAPVVDFGTTTQTAGKETEPVAVSTEVPVPKHPVQAMPAQALVPNSTVKRSGSDGTSSVNINTAGPDELDALHGIGPALARRIVEDRLRQGPFSTAESLTRVKGIGPSILQKNRGRITVQ